MPVARLRGVFVGCASGTVAAAAHASGGGVVAPGGPATAALIAACCVIGVLVDAVPHRPGAARLLLALTLGQAAGHWALTAAPEHHQGQHAHGVMLAAHLAAIPLGAVLIAAAERAVLAGVTALARVVRMPAGGPAPVVVLRVAPPRAVAGPIVERPLVGGSGLRGPPGLD